MNEPHESVVVGVDGSAQSDAAVQWAVRYVEAAGGRLALVTAWTWPLWYGVPMTVGNWRPEDEAGRVLEKAAAQVPLASEQLDLRLVQGPPATVLEEASRHAALLVVGGHGHGRVVGSHLGSVSNHCAHHAHCPVVVVRGPSTGRGSEGGAG